MLVITQKEGEGLVIGEEVKILIKWIHGNKVRFCIKAPRDVLLRRTADGFPEFEVQPEPVPAVEAATTMSDAESEPYIESSPQMKSGSGSALPASRGPGPNSR